MGIYDARDVETDDMGELQVDRGDLALGSVLRSHVQALHWVLASERADCPISSDIAAALSSFVGDRNLPRTHRMMEQSIRRAVAAQGVFFLPDLAVSVVPVGPYEVAVTVRLVGEFVETDPGDIEEDEQEQTLAYVYTFGNGVLQKVA